MKGPAEIFFRVFFLMHLTISFGSEHLHFGTWLNIRQDEHLYAFEWIVKVSIKQCVDACKFTKTCQYINYDVRAHTCGLIRTVEETNNNIADGETKPGYIFGKKSEWTPATSNICDTCNNQGQCHDDDISESETRICRNSGCRKPVVGILGNMFSFDGRIRQSCKEGNELYPPDGTMGNLRCLHNGEWLADRLPVCSVAHFNGSTYYIQTVLMTWYDAKTNCERLSGHLIDINSAAEQRFLQGLVKGYDIIWTGGNDLEDEGTFLWSDGSTVSSGFTHWLMWEPNNSGRNEHCLIIMGTNWFGWNDETCDKKHISVCEF